VEDRDPRGFVGTVKLLYENRWLWALILLGAVVIWIVVFLYGQWVSRRYGFQLGQGGSRVAGEFGDTFGVLTAFFTGAGFVGGGLAIFSQLQNLRREEDLELLATTMRTVNEMDSYFDTDRMRNLRCVASNFFLKEIVSNELENDQLYEKAAEHLAKSGIGQADKEVEEFAVRDVLNFLERVAHFTTHDAVKDDLVLSVFHLRLKVYYEYGTKYFPPLRDVEEHSLLWRELRDVCKEEGRIARWLNEEYKDKKIPEADRDDIHTVYSDEVLLANFKREHVRCHATF
jgi:hypothetical protein